MVWLQQLVVRGKHGIASACCVIANLLVFNHSCSVSSHNKDAALEKGAILTNCFMLTERQTSVRMLNYTSDIQLVYEIANMF